MAIPLSIHIYSIKLFIANQSAYIVSKIVYLGLFNFFLYHKIQWIKLYSQNKFLMIPNGAY